MSMSQMPPEPSRYMPRDQIVPQPDQHPHPHERKPHRHPLRKLTGLLRRKKDS
jgi:hypothetical protein